MKSNSKMRKRTISLLLVFSLLLSVAFVTPLAPMAEAADGTVKFYIAPNGSDSNNGAISTPFKTLEGAQQAIRRLKADNEGKLPQGGVTVYLREGRYERLQSFKLIEADAGTAETPIVYTSYPGETVFLDGGKLINPNDVVKVTDQNILNRIVEVNARDYIQEIDLRNIYNITNFGEYGPRGFHRPYVNAPLELFIDGASQQIARYPNLGEADIPLGQVINGGSIPRDGNYNLTPATFKYDIARAEQWTQAKDMYVSGIFHHSYADDTIKVAKIDTAAGTFTTDLPHVYGFARTADTQWHAVNLLEEIDVPGEYFVNKETGKLYVYPPYDLSGAKIQVSVLDDPMVSMMNTSYISFERLVFENARGMGIYIEGGKNNTVNGSTIRNMGLVGFMTGQGSTALPHGTYDTTGKEKAGVSDPEPKSEYIGSMYTRLYEFAAWNRNGGTNHGIKNSNIYNMGTGGVILGGGDRKSLVPANNYVENCEIFLVNRFDRSYKTAVNLDGVGNIVRNNIMHDLAGQAILLHGNDHVIEYNEIYNVLLEMAENGAIYMGRDSSEVGTKIQHNFFHHIVNNLNGGAPSGPQSVSFDDKAAFNSVYKNLFFQSTGDNNIMGWNGGGYTTVTNNIALDSRGFASGSGNIQGSVKNTEPYKSRALTSNPNDYRGVNIIDDVWKEAYPYLYQVWEGTYFRMNGIVNYNNIQLKGDYSHFEDIATMDFRLKKESSLFNKVEKNVMDPVMGYFNQDVSFTDIEFEKIGLYADPYRTTLLATPQSKIQEKKEGSIFFDSFENGMSNWTIGAGMYVPSSVKTHSGKYAYVTDDDKDVIHKKFNEKLNKKVSVWFYDKSNTNSNNMVRIDNGVWNDENNWRGIGVNHGVSKTNYVYRVGKSVIESMIPRKTGWHELTWDYTSGTHVDMYIDNTMIARVNGMTSFDQIAMGNWLGGVSYGYFDDVDVYDDGIRSDIQLPEIEDFEVISPVANMEGVNGWNATFEWEEAEGAEVYEVVIATDEDFSNLVASDRTSDTSKVIKTLEANTKYYWKVMASTFEAVAIGGKWSENVGTFTTGNTLNESFENGFAGWTVEKGTATVTNAQAHEGKYSYYQDEGEDFISKTFEHKLKGIVTFWYYDNMSTGSKQLMTVVDKASIKLPWVSMGVETTKNGASGKTNYQARIDDSFIDTGITRRQGWHEFKWDYTGEYVKLYIDNVEIAGTPGTDAKLKNMKQFDYIAMGDSWPQESGTGYFDDITISNIMIDVKGVALNGTELELEVEETKQLIAAVQPTSATNKQTTWTSSNEAVATVDENGVVTGIAAGEATITVTTEEGAFTASTVITVQNKGSNVIVVTGVSLDRDAFELGVGNVTQLVATVRPVSAENKNVVWSSSNEAVATVNSNGIVEAIDEGTATITVTTEDGGHTATSVATVKDKVTTVIFSESFENGFDAWMVNKGTATTSTAQSHHGEQSYVIDENEDFISRVFSGISGNMKAVATVWFYDDMKNPKKILISAHDAAAFKWLALGVDTEKTNGNENYQFRITDMNDQGNYYDTQIPRTEGWHEFKWDYTGEHVKLYIDDSEVEVTDSLILGATVFNKMAMGDDWPTVTSSGYIDDIKIFDPVIEVTSVTVSEENIELTIGDTKKLYALIEPIDASNKKVTWTSSDDTIATVDETGVVTAVAVGMANIVVTTDDSNYKASSTVTVTAKAPETVRVTGVTLDKSALELVAGYTGQLLATVAPANATNKSLTWTSSDEAIAKVSASGLVTAVAEGTATITATTVDGNFKAESTVTVKKRVIPPTTDPTPTPEPTPKPTPEPTPGPTEKPNVFDEVIVDFAQLVKDLQSRMEAANETGQVAELHDVKGHWAEQAIGIFTELQIVKGYEDGTFRPDGDITRAEFATLIYRIFGIKSETANVVALKDIEGHWAQKAIEQLAGAGIIFGYGDGSFQPERTISREELVIILSRILNAEQLEKDPTKGNFTDLDVTGSYAKEAIQLAAQAGLIKGKGNGAFDPKGNSTRAEVVTILLRTMQLNPAVKELLEGLK